ncbi:MAG: translocation/assembly module TamB domain-containing protein [Chitinophagales bacterium]|nr:translocation/assembly module TamB domain-containing protein [Chitinophagales bacterium]MCZ2393133.1 translocation/assembly module TamB domain-containing protein [Chitinophagales bacterium]
MFNKIIKYIFNGLGFILVSALAFIILLFFIIQQESVQTWLVGKATDYLSEKTGTELSVGHVGIKFFRTVSLGDIYVEDKNGDTLAYIRNLDTKLAYFNPFTSKFHFNNLTLEGVRANIYRTENDSTFNYQFLIDAFAGKPSNPSKPKKKASNTPIDIRIKEIHLADIAVIFDDKMGGQGHQIQLNSLDLLVNGIDISSKNFIIDKLAINQPMYVLTIYKHDEDTTISPPFKVNMGLNLQVKELQLANGHFGLHDYTHKRTYSKDGFEYSWFDVDSIQADISDFKWDSIMSVNIHQVAARSVANDINLTNLSLQGQLKDTQISGENLSVKYNQSVVKGRATLDFDSFDDFGDFLNKVHIQADLQEVKSNGNDVGVWARVAQQYVPNAFVSGQFDGTIANFTAKNLIIRANQYTEILGDVKMKGIPDPDLMFIDANIRSIKTRSDEIKSIISYVKLPKELDALGKINGQGSYKGFIKDFNAQLDLQTDIGQLTANAYLKFPKIGVPIYRGSVKSQGIQLAKIVNSDKINNIAFDLNIDGSGFDLDHLNTSVQGKISNVDFNYYRYKDITLNGQFSNKKFEGAVQLIDDCASLNFNGLVDLNNPEKPIYNFYAKLDKADLQQLKFIPNKLIVSVEGNFQFEGKDINNLTGQAQLANIHLVDNQYNVNLSDLLICLEKFGEYKEYSINSHEINGYMKGYFDPIKLPASLQFFLSKHTTLLKSPGIEKLDDLIFPQDLEMNIRISKDIGLAALLDPKIKSFSDITLKGTYNSENEKANLNLIIDSLNYDNMKFHLFKANIFDRNDSLIITSNLGKIGIGNTEFNNIHLGATTNLSGFYSRLKVENDTAKNNLELVTVVNFSDDTINIKFPRSRIKINNKNWVINPTNNIIIVDSIFQLNNFVLQQGDQKISIENRQNLSDAFVKIEKLDIADLAQVIDSTKIIKSGYLDANLRLKNALKSPEIDGDIILRHLNVYEEEVDSIKLIAKLSDKDQNLNIDGFIKDNDYDISLNGNYSTDKKSTQPIDLNVDFSKISLKFLSFPIILGNEISNLKAFAKGKIHVGGSFKDIALDGKASIIDTASLKVNFLGTTLKFANEDIVLKPRSIEFYKGGLFDKSITLMDEFNNKATLKAKLEHHNFQDMSVQAQIITDKFNFLNTKYKDNPDFFGKVYASGIVNINGPLNNINMDITAKTLPNTEFNIVVAGTSGDQIYDFVKFTDRSKLKDTTHIDIKKATSTPSSINLEMNINATQDALLKMYLDYAKNDVIRARGNGELQLVISPNSMQMFGDYVATSGDYLFSQQEIVNKKFSIKNGSTISWNGDIMDAKMNVDALYSSRVSMNDIVDSTSNLRNKRFPVDVVLKIGGTLAETDIKFALAPPSGQSSIPDELNAVIERINNDPAQVNTQAFGLILFNRFLNLQNTSNAQAGTIGVDLAITTLSEFFNAKISEYVNDALSMLIPGAEVAINQGTDNTGIRVTQKLNNDRLIINLGGDVQYGNRENIQLQENNTGFVGDVEIEYLITEDGRIRAKVYSRYDNTIIRLENESYLKSGIGITYQKEVDKFLQLFKPDNNKKRKDKKTVSK